MGHLSQGGGEKGGQRVACRTGWGHWAGQDRGLPTQGRALILLAQLV